MCHHLSAVCIAEIFILLYIHHGDKFIIRIGFCTIHYSQAGQWPLLPELHGLKPALSPKIRVWVSVDTVREDMDSLQKVAGDRGVVSRDLRNYARRE